MKLSRIMNLETFSSHDRRPTTDDRKASPPNLQSSTFNLPADSQGKPLHSALSTDHSALSSLPSPRISIIIPVYNAARTLPDCLGALLASDYPNFEVIVVDDASTDNSAEVASQQGAQVLRQPQNIGAARAKNRGAAAATGEILFFTDADIVVRPDTLQRIATTLADPSLAGVVGLLGERLRYGNFASQYKNLWMHFTYQRQPAGRPVGLFYTSAAAIRRAVFQAFGGFDENYSGASVTEDIEFGQRLLAAGQRVVLDKALQVEHLKHYTLPGLLRTDRERAYGLMQTWLRRTLSPGPRQPTYASVPWYFQLAVPASLTVPLTLLLALPWSGRRRQLAYLALGEWLGLLLLNWPFLAFLGRLRGPRFFAQSALFLPVNLWTSALGILDALKDRLRGKHY
jgi:glycosyltransferase involved in cell wall biosynthesis